MYELFLMVLVIVGLSFLGLGWRGEFIWSAPACAKCGVDLRDCDPALSSCPKCLTGLTKRHAVRLASLRRGKKWMLVGVVLIVLPFGVGMTERSWKPVLHRVMMSVKSNEMIIAKAGVYAPWPNDSSRYWREIERRYDAGEFTEEDIDEVVDALAALWGALQSSGMIVDRSGSYSFYRRLDEDGLIDEARFGRLFKVKYSNTPTVTLRDTVRAGAEFEFQVKYGTGNFGGLPGMVELINLRRVMLDGERELQAHEWRNDETDLSAIPPFEIMGDLIIHAKPGDHTLTFEIEVGLLDKKLEDLLPWKPGPMSDWPPTRRQWVASVTVPIEVVGEEASVVELVKDPTLAEEIRSFFRLRGLTVKREGEFVRVKCNLRFPRNPPIPISMTVLLRLSGQEYYLGSQYIDAGRGGSGGTGGFSTRLEDTGYSWVRGDIILRPSVKDIERNTKITRIWGEEIVFKDVPIQWEDENNPDEEKE